MSRRDGVVQFDQAPTRRGVQAEIANFDEHATEQLGLLGDLQFNALAGHGRK